MLESPRLRVTGTCVRLIFWLCDKLATADEHSVLAGSTPHNLNAIFKFTRFTGQLYIDFTRIQHAFVQQPQTLTADFPRHSRNGIAARGFDFSGY